MNNQTQEALKMAGYNLDGVIADFEKFNCFDNVCLETIKRVRNIIAQALEQPAQEPVGYLQEESPNGKGFFATYLPMKDMKNIPLYTHPHQWQGLTDDEINELVVDTNADIYGCSIIEFVSAIEQALKEKNT